jgi:hypothetical protein
MLSSTAFYGDVLPTASLGNEDPPSAVMNGYLRLKQVRRLHKASGALELIETQLISTKRSEAR